MCTVWFDSCEAFVILNKVIDWNVCIFLTVDYTSQLDAVSPNGHKKRFVINNLGPRLRFFCVFLAVNKETLSRSLTQSVYVGRPR